jgi:hypothetical protein
MLDQTSDDSDAALPVVCTEQIALKGIMEDYHHHFL